MCAQAKCIDFNPEGIAAISRRLSAATPPENDLTSTIDPEGRRSNLHWGICCDPYGIE
jgi:hypothetical protein